MGFFCRSRRLLYVILVLLLMVAVLTVVGAGCWACRMGVLLLLVLSGGLLHFVV